MFVPFQTHEFRSPKQLSPFRPISFASPSLQPTNAQTFAQLGVLIQAYLVFTDLIGIDLSLLKSDEWHTIVKCQVEKLGDPCLDVSAAYDLLETQHYRCSQCLSDLTVANRPSIRKKTKTYCFLGMNSQKTSYKWICKYCTDRENDLENKIAQLIKEEEEGQEGQEEE